MDRLHLIDKELTHSVIGCFYDVYNALGYGFLEHVYKRALEVELGTRGHSVAREVSVAVFYKDSMLAQQRLDFVVDDRLVVEVKSTQELPGFALRQIYNYLRATNLEIGLLLHFGPTAKVYRTAHPNKKGRLNPPNPLNLQEPSV